MMIAAWQDSIYPASGQGFSLQAIAGVILGGIPFTGGRGTIVGAAIGALIIGVIDDLIVLVGLPTLYTYIFVAIILVIAAMHYPIEVREYLLGPGIAAVIVLIVARWLR